MRTDDAGAGRGVTLMQILSQPQTTPSRDPLFYLHVFLFNDSAPKGVFVLRMCQARTYPALAGTGIA